ncbi:MAG: protein-methionine-sulfoxide reductase heme-binding subunit MsrQ [Motiliproteus sp.]
MLLWWSMFLSCLLPLAWLIYRVVSNDLGSDPAQELVQSTGEWGLRFLWLTLAVTPLRVWLKWKWLQSFRRMLGLYCLFYATIHLFTFITLILEWQWGRLYSEFLERPYISVGVTAYLLLLPLGVTSLKTIMRRMGKRWGQLHRSIYIVAILAFVHLFWQVRSDYLEAVVYGTILMSLFMLRLIWRWPQYFRRVNS